MPDDAAHSTTAQVRKALGGDAEALAWVIKRYSPLLLAQARLRLGPRLRRHHDPEDLVQEVWAVALPKLGTLLDSQADLRAALPAFLGRILLYRTNNLVQKHIAGKPELRSTADGGAVAALPAHQSGVVTKLVRGERSDAVSKVLAQLDDADRRLLMLRGMEHNPVQQIALVLGVSPNLVSVRYRRALEKVRQLLPASVFDELPDA